MSHWSPVSFRRDGCVGWVTINNPPVNAASHAVRLGLKAIAERVEQDEDVNAVVLVCAGSTFVAGADIREHGSPIKEPSLPEVIDAIETSRKPWIAAIHGTAFGGGLELVLGCHGRIAMPGAKLGLPEVTFGIIPGAGGTVRLPRLVPVSVAVEMITTGKPISAERALEVGLVDAIAEGSLNSAACERALDLCKRALPQPLIHRAPIRPPDARYWSETETRIARKSRGQKSPLLALRAVRESVLSSSADALSNERATFLRLTATEEAKALRHVFFAERKAGASLRTAARDHADLSNVGVVGGGTMGAGISAALLMAGSRVTLVERDADSIGAAIVRIHRILGECRDRGSLTNASYLDSKNRLVGAVSYSVLAPCELIIEAVSEDIELKCQIFSDLDKIVSPHSVLASNTSYLDINVIASCTQNPSEVLGLHFFSPAHVMKLIEVVRTDFVSDRALGTARALSRHLKKIAVVSGVCDGFIANRIMSAYRKECDLMLEEGAFPHHIDEAMKKFGYAMGVYEVQDLAGLDIAWAWRRRHAENRTSGESYSRIADRLCEAGRLGRKANAGWYTYENGNPIPDPWVESVIVEESARLGCIRREIAESEIMRRILERMQCEARNVVDDGIAESADDIDVAMILGHGFPRYRGGPMYMLKQEIGPLVAP